MSLYLPASRAALRSWRVQVPSARATISPRWLRIARLDILQHEAAGELALLLLDADHALDRGDAVARANMAEQFPVVAGVKTVDAGQAPAGAADPAEGHREHRVRDDRAVAAQAAILGVAVERVEIADAVAEVADRVRGRVLQIGPFGAQLQADHLPRGSNRLVGDFSLGRC